MWDSFFSSRKLSGNLATIVGKECVVTIFFFSRRIFSTHLDEDMGEMKCGKLEQILMMMMNFIHYEEKGDMT